MVSCVFLSFTLGVFATMGITYGWGTISHVTIRAVTGSHTYPTRIQFTV